MLQYLNKSGFSSQNMHEAIQSIKGGNNTDSPTYCLTFDDYQSIIWKNQNIRNLFNEFGAKPTLIYIVDGNNLDAESPLSKYISKDDFYAMKNAGWDMISHGFTMYVNRMSYAQFKTGFEKTKALS